MTPSLVRRLRLACGIIATLTLLTGAKVSTPTETLEEVISAYTKAIGGASGLTSLVEQGVIEGDKTEQLKIVYAKAPNKIRIEILTPTGRLIQGFDGFTPWCLIEPRAGKPVALPLDSEDEQHLRFAARTVLRDPMIDAQALGFTLTLRNDDPDAEGQHLVVVRDANREHFCLQIERRTGRPLAKLENRNGRQIVLRHKSFRLVDGRSWPTETETHVDGLSMNTWRLANLRLNEELADDLFAPPAGASSTTPAL